MIAKKPRMLAITLLLILLAAGAMVYFTFTAKYRGGVSSGGIADAYSGNIRLPRDMYMQLAELIDDSRWGYWPRNTNPDGKVNKPRREYRFIMPDGGEYILKYYWVSDFSFNPMHWGEYGERYTLVYMENDTEKRAWSLPYSFTYSKEMSALKNELDSYLDSRVIENLYGRYEFDEALYVWPLSSFYPFQENMPDYEITEQAFTIKGEQVETYPLPSYTEKAVDEDEFNSSFEMLDPPDISGFRDRYCFDIYAKDGTPTGYSLFLMDQEVWLATGIPDSGKIQFLYKLKRIAARDS